MPRTRPSPAADIGECEMPGYEPIDIGGISNVGADWVRGLGQPWIPHDRSSAFHGLPFLLGSPAGQIIGFGDGVRTDTLAIPIERKLTWVVVAHRLLESHMDQGEPFGRLIATYRFTYADEATQDVPIRERLEISTAPILRGHPPFLAVPDQADGLFPEFEGPWGQTGFRQTEVIAGVPRAYVLWAWRNDRPDVEVASMVIEPHERPFLIGGVTTSSLPEDPLPREPMVPVRITSLAQDGATIRPRMSLSVDRGVASYMQPVLHRSPEEFIAAPEKGWGSPISAVAGDQAYADVAAKPSATVSVNDETTPGAAIPWSDVLETGSAERDGIKLETLSGQKNWVHVRVEDADTGELIPCRVHFRSPDGVPFQPHGHHNHLLSHDHDGTWQIDVGGDALLGSVVYAYIDGSCQGWLPRGRVIVDVARGFEYEPFRGEMTIGRGQRDLTIRLKRWVDMNDRRWFSGDPHVHFLSTYGALLEGQGEGLNVVNLLQSQWGHLFTNVEDFTGRPVVSDTGKTIVYTSQENRQHMLGHLSLLGLKRPIMPWGTDGPNPSELGGTLETTMSYWADDCHDQGGTVVIPHLGMPKGEQAALVVTGRADAAEMIEHETHRHIEYYGYLNSGYRLPIAGGSDKMSAQHLVGLYRTYVHIPPDEEFSYESWCRNLRLGRTFLSGGPILHFSVDGAMIGDTLQFGKTDRMVEIEASADSIFPVHTLQIVRNGKVIAASESRNGTNHLQLKDQVRVESDSWFAARVGGPGYLPTPGHHDSRRRGVIAHTSPIYVGVGVGWDMQDADTSAHMLTLFDAQLRYIRERSRQFPPGSVTHHHGEDDHLGYLERPFHEAIAAVRSRLN